MSAISTTKLKANALDSLHKTTIVNAPFYRGSGRKMRLLKQIRENLLELIDIFVSEKSLTDKDRIMLVDEVNNTFNKHKQNMMLDEISGNMMSYWDLYMGNSLGTLSGDDAKEVSAMDRIYGISYSRHIKAGEL